MREIVLALGLLMLPVSAATAQSLERKAVSFVGLPLATDSTYGYTPENPIKVGGIKEEQKNQNQLRYLERLRGPKGEKVVFERRGSCCAHDNPNGFMGRGLLDQYEVRYAGREGSIILYLSLYDYDDPKIPVGFSAASL